MPEHGRVAEKRRQSYLSSFKQWLSLKQYQYEVTFSLYMLTRTEKIIFNVILILLVSMLVAAATMYLPGHVMVIYNRMSYYVHGDFAYNTVTAASGETIAFAKEGLRMTSETLKSTAAEAMATMKEL